jgi:hypothetical protein
MDYYEGDPDSMDITKTRPAKLRGSILDISKGGTLIISNMAVAVRMPVHLTFMLKKEKHERSGKIIRTGLLNDNPSEVAMKIAGLGNKENYYIAVEFDDIITNLSEHDI